MVRQPALLAGIGIIRHHEVPPGQRSPNVDLRARRGVSGMLHGLAWAEQRLRWNARPVCALAADQLSLNDGDAHPARSKCRSTVLTRRPAAENDRVILTARAHGYLRRLLAPLPPRAALASW